MSDQSLENVKFITNELVRLHEKFVNDPNFTLSEYRNIRRRWIARLENEVVSIHEEIRELKRLTRLLVS